MDYEVGNLYLKVAAQMNNVETQFRQANNQLSRTKRIIDSLSKSFTQFSTSAKSVDIKAGGGSGFSSRATKNIGIAAFFGKWNYMINMARYYGQAIANIVQYAMDYVETLNLWQVANRENIALADEFINKMTKAYGVSEQALMNYQAIFKNMLAALGDLSDTVSSTLSMQLTQLALDFSSLYNVTIASAMEKFQAVLSGQVRPIRSISGYDITENTIYDLYSGAGGEKTVRNLSQIEKRLLRIVAVFDQMSATGAVGDMEKTIESASNQARVMGEQFKEVLTWSGQTILLWLNNNKVFQYVNAALITMKEIMKAIAYDLGYQEQDFLSGMIMQAESADEALDEVQGKLLSFDKFEALNSGADNVLGIDPVIEDMISRINVEMESFQMEAQQTSAEWLKMLGLVDENGDGIYELSAGLREALGYVKDIAIAIGIVLGFGLAKRLLTLVTGVNSLKGALSGLLAVGIVYFIIEMVEAFKEGDYWTGILAGTITGVLVVALLRLNGINIISWLKNISLTLPVLNNNFLITTNAINGMQIAMGALVGVLSFLLFDGILSSIGEEARSIVAPIMLAVGAVGALVTAFLALQGIMSWGTAIPILLASVGAAIAGAKSMLDGATSINAYATGGFPQQGELFIAREAGAEMVGKIGNKTAVANNDQIVAGISQAVYEAVRSAQAQQGQGATGNVYIDGTKVGKVVTKSVYNEGVRIGVFSKA